MDSHIHNPNTHEARSLLGIEALRFICATSVLLWHYNHFFMVGHSHQGFTTELQPWYAIFKPFYEAGWLGVQAFWSLSGFIFFWKYAQPISEGTVPVRKFVILRYSRLYPLHLLTLIAVAAMAYGYRLQNGVDYIYQHNDWPHFALQIFMASDWPGKSEWSFNGPIWSVSIEILVYTLFYALCRGLRWTRSWQILVILTVSAAAYARHLTDHPVIQCIFFFYLGALSYKLHAFIGQQSPRAQKTTLWIAALAFSVAIWGLSSGHLRPMIFVAIQMPGTILLMLHLVQPKSAQGIRLLSTLGNTTYASYLLNYPLQLLVALLCSGDPSRLPLASPYWLMAYLGITFGLAAWVYQKVEIPAQKRLRRWLLPA